jgi:hypothetical protein
MRKNIIILLILWKKSGAKAGIIAFALARHGGTPPFQFDHGGRLQAAETAVHHQVYLVLQAMADFLRIAQGQFLARQDQCGTHQGLIQFG